MSTKNNYKAETESSYIWSVEVGWEECLFGNTSVRLEFFYYTQVNLINKN